MAILPVLIPETIGLSATNRTINIAIDPNTKLRLVWVILQAYDACPAHCAVSQILTAIKLKDAPVRNHQGLHPKD